MRVLGKVALGGTVASVATAGWLVAAGVFATSATLVVADPVARPAQAEGLTSFDSCAALLDWYVERGVKDVGAYGWNYPYYALGGDLRSDVGMMSQSSKSMRAVVPMAGAVAGTTDSVAGSATGTNTQEADVDESDVAKTNGSLVVRIVGDRRLVLIDVAHGEPTVTRRLVLPSDGYNSELLLLGDRVLVTQQSYRDDPRLRGELDSLAPYPGTTGNNTRLLEVDISDPHAPRLLSTTEYSGQLLSLRQYGDTVRMVTSTNRPELAWAHPRKGVSEHEAVLRNRALVRKTTIKDWLPTVGTKTNAQRLVDCDQVFHPDTWSGGSTVAVTSFDIKAPTERTSVAVTADGQVVYSSTDRLYLAATEFGKDRLMEGDVIRPSNTSDPVRTDLYAFALDGLSTPYLGAGQVNGTLRDRWSLDEYDGKLRVAWSKSGARGGTQSGITVFSEGAGRLVPTGTVDGLGKNEDIQAVRWFDDLAIVVTFRQVDPLYTIDLSDPAHPRKVGALKIPGYSGYLHPIGGDQLLGLGMAADSTGSVQGGQAAVFDIADLTDPRRISQHGFGPDTGLPALDDPRGFTWLPASRTAVTSVADWMSGHAKLVALEVGPAGNLHVRTLATLNQDWQARTLPLPGGRVAILDSHRLRVVTVG